MALKTARAKLSRATKEAKHAHTQRIHSHFQDNRDSQDMWQGIQAITNYRTTSSAYDSDASLPDALKDFYAIHSSNHIIKFAVDTALVGLISKNDGSVYREEVQQLTAWCKANNLSMNINKTKEMDIDFRRAHSCHSPLYIDGFSVEIKSTKFFGVHLGENFNWSLNTSSITKKAQQLLSFLWRLRKAHFLPPS
ncbi:hypothetical protein QTP70_023747 [Hemibagrus guttatus]|uniref:Alkylated DNA repair protein AlkB homologue 8 N-terminal domain-containing protein n=1 Tax=Hemibagrus guttatus TaxID=175788 RepID=A0AAE0PR75_9TELE|nr:hypothetical protein QTP70_023747 [Hemibagrus guttatus]